MPPGAVRRQAALDRGCFIRGRRISWRLGRPGWRAARRDRRRTIQPRNGDRKWRGQWMRQGQRSCPGRDEIGLVSVHRHSKDEPAADLRQACHRVCNLIRAKPARQNTKRPARRRTAFFFKTFRRSGRSAPAPRGSSRRADHPLRRNPRRNGPPRPFGSSAPKRLRS